MNTLNAITRALTLGAVGALIFGSAQTGALAQDISTTSVRHGAPSVETAVRNAEVVYVEGNDLVLKLENGRIEHLVVPDSDKFTIGGKDVSVGDLKPGTKLTQSITTTTTPRYVKTIRNLTGKVWHVSAPSTVIVSLPGGENQVFKVPSHAQFTVNGQQKSVFDLRKGMSFQATIVTDDTETVTASNKTIVGVPPAPATPRMVGVLLFQRPSLEPAPTPASSVTAEQASLRLPQTGSPLPLIGLFGLLVLGISLSLTAIRKRFTA
jgi:LPXTG-motif cell wall-anchored protein